MMMTMSFYHFTKQMKASPAQPWNGMLYLGLLLHSLNATNRHVKILLGSKMHSLAPLPVTSMAAKSDTVDSMLYCVDLCAPADKCC